jgi:hypothetical protein
MGVILCHKSRKPKKIEGCLSMLDGSLVFFEAYKRRRENEYSAKFLNGAFYKRVTEPYIFFTAQTCRMTMTKFLLIGLGALSGHGRVT